MMGTVSEQTERVEASKDSNDQERRPVKPSEMLREFAAALNRLADESDQGLVNVGDGAGYVLKKEDGSWDVDIEMSFGATNPIKTH